MQSVKTLLNGIRTAMDSLTAKIKRVSTQCDSLATVPLYEYPVGETVLETEIEGIVTKIYGTLDLVLGQTYYVFMGDLKFKVTAVMGALIGSDLDILMLNEPYAFTLSYGLGATGLEYSGLLTLTVTSTTGFKGKTFKVCKIDPPVKVGEMGLREYIDTQIEASVQDVVRNGDFKIKMTSSDGVQYLVKVDNSGNVVADKIEET